MYFPSDMNFQYFFFNTYPGFFLQALPFALIGGIASALWRRKRAPETSIRNLVLSSLFVCYIVGLLCITLFYYVIGDFYYFLFYHMPSGDSSNWFHFEYDFIPDFFLNFGSENLGNILMFLPFGLLYPFFREHTNWKRTVLAGICVSAGIELLQPIFGRSFDINDIILNSFGVLVSASAFFAIKTVWRRQDKRTTSHERKIPK